MVEASAAAWFGAAGLEVTGVEEAHGEVVVGVQTPGGQVVFCGSCGRRARSKGRREVVLGDAPGADGRAVRVRWNKRIWECRSPRCGAGSWTERSELAGPRRVLTSRAERWVVGRLAAVEGSVASAARRLGVSWRTVWSAVEAAAVFSFDEKTQVQALDRTQPGLPMKRGRAQTMTHDYKRFGTLDLFAALNVATGEVLHQTRRRHTGKDVLAFFKWVDLHTPRHLEVHIVLDNLSAHKSQPVRDWLAHPKRARWHLHFTPTSSLWLNLIESWFSILTRKALTNNSFNSVADLTDTIDTWTEHWNQNPQPLAWTKSANDIIAKTRRAQTALNKSATHH